jgi:hypothetical protein
MALRHIGMIRATSAVMPEKRTIQRARKDARKGRSASTQAGEFVREEMDHIRRGRHGARSTKQAIAIGLSKARRAGVKLRAPKAGATTARARKQATRDLGKAGTKRKTSAKRSRAVRAVLKKEGRSAASKKSLSRQARSSARTRGNASLRRAAAKAVRTKGTVELKRAARKAARTRAAA